MRWFDRLLIFLTALVVTASLLPLGARLWWVLDLTTHFRLQYLALIAPLLALTAARRLWRPAVALLCAGAFTLVPVLPYVPQPAEPVAIGPPPMTIAAINVSFRQFSPRRLLQIIADASPDVLLLVEFTPHAAEVLKKLDDSYAYQLKLPAEGPYGIALYSRFELASAAPFSLGSVPAVQALVRGPNGAFTFVGVHLSAPTSPRRATQRTGELKLLAEHRATIAGPLVVAGDFNLTPYSPYYQDWIASSGLTDTRRHRTLSVSWPAVLPILGIPIDHVAVSKDFDILAHKRLDNFDSDHYGILAALALRDGPAP